MTRFTKKCFMTLDVIILSVNTTIKILLQERLFCILLKKKHILEKINNISKKYQKIPKNYRPCENSPPISRTKSRSIMDLQKQNTYKKKLPKSWSLSRFVCDNE